MAEAIVEIQDDELKALCKRLNSASLSSEDRRRLLSSIGVEMETQTKERLATQNSAPDGEKWKNLANSTKKYYLKKFGTENPKTKLLYRTGSLLDSVTSETDNWSVLVGATKVYAAVHQWGYKKIPARKYLGLSTQDKADVMAIIEQFMSERL